MKNHDDDLSTEITLKSSGSEARLPAIPEPILEALFHTVTGAKESFGLKRRLPKRITTNDLTQLEYLLSQWSEPFEPIGPLMSISLQSRANDDISGTNNLSYESIDSLIRYETGRTEAIEGLQVFLA